jgi:hypothetical protein
LSSIGKSWSLGIGDWSSMSIVGNWGSLGIGNWGMDGLGNNSLLDSWGRSLNNSVESVDWVSGVGHSSDGTIGLNKRVLSLDNISVSGLGGGLGVSGEGIGDRVSVVVLWVWVVWLRLRDDS